MSRHGLILRPQGIIPRDLKLGVQMQRTPEIVQCTTFDPALLTSCEADLAACQAALTASEADLAACLSALDACRKTLIVMPMHGPATTGNASFSKSFRASIGNGTTPAIDSIPSGGVIFAGAVYVVCPDVPSSNVVVTFTTSNSAILEIYLGSPFTFVADGVERLNASCMVKIFGKTTGNATITASAPGYVSGSAVFNLSP